MRCDLDVREAAAMEASDDAGAKESVVCPVTEEGRFVAPAILAEQQLHTERQFSRQRCEGSC